MLAHALKAKGLRVAHVVYPVPEPRRVDASSPTLVERSDWQGDRRLGQLAETGAIWRGLQRADAEAYIVRGSGGHVIAASTFCRARGRRFVFSSSSELDFDFARPDRNRPDASGLQGQPPPRRPARPPDRAAAGAGPARPPGQRSRRDPELRRAGAERERRRASTSSGRTGSSSTSSPTATWSWPRRSRRRASGWSPR